jgi:beta-glucanase (GH16 family)
MGYGGATAFDNRKLSATSVAVDPQFAGVENGVAGTRPLGLNPFELEPGKSLTIVARPLPPALQAKMWNAKYFSGQINTRFSFSQRYGYFEVEAMLPAGKGLWPQFWLLPIGGNWPAGGEIDVFEGLGDPRAIYTTVHWGADRKQHKQEQRKIALPFDASAGFHRYGVAWNREAIVWYVDRREVMRVATPAEIQQPVFMILGLGVGGPWGGYPDATTQFPARFAIRRVQAWALEQ